MPNLDMERSQVTCYIGKRTRFRISESQLCHVVAVGPWTCHFMAQTLVFPFYRVNNIHPKLPHRVVLKMKQDLRKHIKNCQVLHKLSGLPCQKQSASLSSVVKSSCTGPDASSWSPSGLAPREITTVCELLLCDVILAGWNQSFANIGMKPA